MMKKEEIDQRDLELLKKIDKIRKKNIATAKKTTQKIIIFTSTLIIVILLLYVVAKKNGTESDNLTFQKKTDRSFAPEKKILPVATAVQKKSADNKTVAPASTIALADKAGITTENIKAEIKTKKILLRIAGCFICSDIKDKTPQGLKKGPKKIFYITQDKSAFVWTEIRAESFPAIIYHTYYLNGEKKYTVPLKIKYCRMRTWSKITLNNETKAGLWKVEISLEDGTILKQVEFEVI
ncbi:MAG: DUF2914 domain-containing protein [Deltaproteobacteria bacterium]|nr:DUF2914 domain-containing protein [Deltaproteobacteria bacterium]